MSGMWTILLCIVALPAVTSTRKFHCGGTQRLTGEEGVIVSHSSAGSDYSNNLRCIWIVTGRPRKVVRLRFIFLETETCASYLLVFDGPSTGSKQISKLCDSYRPANIYSSGQSLTLQFRTDSTRGNNGLRIHYKLVNEPVEGNEVFHGEEGVILSHASAGSGNYPNNLKFKWIIAGRRGHVVHLHFVFFSLETFSGCKYDSLTVYDGPNGTSKNVMRLCGSAAPADIFSRSRSVTLKFKSDSTVTTKGFRIRYKLISETFGSGEPRNLPEEEGVILSHPSAGLNNYPNYVNSKWIVTGRVGKVVRLHLDFFSLEKCSHCGCDSLTVYDGPDDTSKEIRRLCGSSRQADIYSSGQSLTLRFRSDHSGVDKGFWIRYKVINIVPTITTLPSGEVLVGKYLLCVGDASPPARVTLNMESQGLWRCIASGINTAKYRLPMNSSEGAATVQCIANNADGVDEKTANISVKKLPLPVELDMDESPFDVKEKRNIICRTERPDSDLYLLQLHFSTHSVFIRNRKDRSHVEIFSVKMGFENIKTFPYNAAGVTILRPPSSGQAIHAILTATPRHNGCSVTCVGYSEPNKGKEGKQTKRIQVQWPPSVRSLSVHGSKDSRSPVTAHEPATIRCELHKGDTTQRGNVSVTTTVGGRDLGVPRRSFDVVDQDGYRWKALIWNHQFRQENNGTSVVCGIEGANRKLLTVDVQYKPRSFILSPAREIFAGESINCSADANPPPVVKIEGFGSTARGVSIAYLAVPTTAKGRYNVSCTTKNSVGSESTTVAIVVHKNE